jgi:hypothetical protein
VSKDNRDWIKYNDELVRRGEIELDAKIMEEWNKELKKENDGKVGEPFHYPEPYIRLIAFIRLLFHLPYGQTEGFMTFLSKYVDGLKAIDHSTLNRRVNKIEIELEDSLLKSNNPVSIAVDSFRSKGPQRRRLETISLRNHFLFPEQLRLI